MSVADRGEYSHADGHIVVRRPPRVYFADIAVLGVGGRNHVFLDCLTLVPLRPGDPVAIEVPHSDPRQGVIVVGRQTPSRPLMWAGRSGLAAVGETAVRWRLGPRAPFARLGWEQGYYFDVSVAAAIGWPGDGNWSGDRPTIMPMDLRMALQTMDMDSSGWADVEELTVQTAHTFLRPDSGAGTGRWHWSGIISVDDGHGAVAAALATDPPASIGIWIDAGNVNWRDDSTGAWHTTTPDTVAVDANGYSVKLIEAGSGTY